MNTPPQIPATPVPPGTILEAPPVRAPDPRTGMLPRLTAWRVGVPAALLVAVAAAGAWRHRVTRPDYRLARGEAAIAERDWRAAEGFAARLEATGQTDRAHLLRAMAFQARNEPELALRECNQVAEGGPFHLRAAQLAGRCLLDLGALVEADRVYSFVVAREPDNADAHRGLAAVAYELGHMDRAIAQLERVVRLDPGDARPHRMLGEIYRTSDDTLNGVVEFQEALRIGTGLSETARNEVRFEIAEGLVHLRRFDEALAAIDEAGTSDTEPSPMHALRIEALRGNGRRSEAIELVDRALAQIPDGPFYRLRGQIYLEDGDARAAIPLLERSAQLSPHHYQSHFLLAQAYRAAGRTADADKERARADQIQKDYELGETLGRLAISRPWDPAVRVQLAELCDRLGDAKSAAMWRRAAAGLQPQIR